MASEKKYNPTESELEILQVLWDKGEATVREVHEVLSNTRDTGYTTTLKTMQIMTVKKLLERDTAQRTHIYSPLIEKEKIQRKLLDKMKDGLFNGSASRLVMGALNDQSLSREELKELRNFLDKFEE